MKPAIRYLLIGMFIWCLFLLGFRIVYWESTGYSFLPYNLLLATIPLLFSHLAVQRKAIRDKLVLSLLWLLFFPNAPYLVTDLIHLSHKRDASLVYDVVMLLSYASVGAIIGFLSLQQMQGQIAARGYPRLSWFFAIGCLFLGAFGIYLGRVVRLNSWDILVRPFRLFTSALAPILHPPTHLSMWAVTLGMGILLSLGYGFFALCHPAFSPRD